MKVTLRSSILCLIACCIGYFVAYYLPTNKLDAVIRIFVSLYPEQNQEQRVLILNYRSHDFPKFIDSLAARSPKFIILDFYLDEADVKTITHRKNVLYPENGDEINYETAGELNFGIDKRGQYIKKLMTFLEVEDRGKSRDFVLVRFNGDEAKFKFVSNDTELTNATVVVGQPFSHEEDFVVRTPIGDLPDTVFLAYLVSSLLSYGVEKSSIWIELSLVVCLFLIHMLLNQKLEKSRKLLLLLYFIGEQFFLIILLVFAFVSLNVWITPWFAIAAILLNYIDVLLFRPQSAESLMV
jgi:hypothetical protein